MNRATGLLILALSAFALPVDASTSLPMQAEGQSLPSLAPVIERVSPTVVNIGVRGTVQAPRNPFFDDPFFRRFFGTPPGGAPREREFRSAGSGVIVDARINGDQEISLWVEKGDKSLSFPPSLE